MGRVGREGSGKGGEWAGREVGGNGVGREGSGKGEEWEGRGGEWEGRRVGREESGEWEGRGVGMEASGKGTGSSRDDLVSPLLGDHLDRQVIYISRSVKISEIVYSGFMQRADLLGRMK